jgi:hypothetical protein
MSETLMVWKPQSGLTQAPHLKHLRYLPRAGPCFPTIRPCASLADLFVALPPLESGSERSPWTVTPFVADGHVALGVSGDIINTTCDVIHHAFRHGLVVYHAEINQLYDAAWDEEAKRE